MDITCEETASKGVYRHSEPGLPVAELTYSRAGEKLVILDHTGVPDEYRGKGVGLALVERAVEDARKEGRKIIPLCPFAAAMFRRQGEAWADVLN